jgi:uncharacterized protein YgiM (DUF1202 family)
MHPKWLRGLGAARLTIAIAAALALGLGGASRLAAHDGDLPAVGGEIAPVYAIGQTVVVATDRLNLRVEPGLAGEVLVVLTEGQAATVVAGPIEQDEYLWYQLDAEGTTGWSAASFLAAAESDATESDVSGDLAIGGGEAAGSSLSIGSVAVVTDDNVNLRAEPSLEAEVLLTLDTGTTATVLDGPVDAEGYVWYQLGVAGAAGWTAGDFLAPATPDDGSSFAAGDTVAINDDDVNLRAATGLDAEILNTLSAGTTATVLDGPVETDGYAWYLLDVNGVSGWVASEFLSAA